MPSRSSAARPSRMPRWHSSLSAALMNASILTRLRCAAVPPRRPPRSNSKSPADTPTIRNAPNHRRRSPSHITTPCAPTYMKPGRWSTAWTICRRGYGKVVAMFDDSARLRLLHELGRAFAARTDLDELCSVVTRDCASVLRAEGASILLLDPQTNELFFPYVANAD